MISNDMQEEIGWMQFNCVQSIYKNSDHKKHLLPIVTILACIKASQNLLFSSIELLLYSIDILYIYLYSIE